MRTPSFRLIGLCLAAAACSPVAGNNQAQGNGAAIAAAPDRVRLRDYLNNVTALAPNAATSRDQILHSETVTGRFTGWEMGDYLWAHIAVPGHAPISAQPGPTPVDLFLDANRGREVTVDIATVRADVPENGGPTEIQRITGARTGAVTAQSWWQGLSAADRAAAQGRFEEGALSGG